MNVAIAAMIAGCLRHRRRDHAVTWIHDTLEWMEKAVVEVKVVSAQDLNFIRHASACLGHGLRKNYALA